MDFQGWKQKKKASGNCKGVLSSTCILPNTDLIDWSSYRWLMLGSLAMLDWLAVQTDTANAYNGFHIQYIIEIAHNILTPHYYTYFHDVVE